MSAQVRTSCAHAASASHANAAAHLRPAPAVHCIPCMRFPTDSATVKFSRSSHLRWRPCRTPALRYYSHYSLLRGPQACICAREVVPDARCCLFHRAALGSTVHALTHPHKRPPLHGAFTHPPTHSKPKASQSTSNARIFSASASCKTSHHTSHIMVACSL
jgi:hypothetical protein